MDLAGFVAMLMGLVSSSPSVKELQQSGPAQWIDNPRFCNGLDCPPYRLIDTIRKSSEGSPIELREYKQVDWVSTMMEVASLKDVDGDTRPMFMKLFNYIGGENAAKRKIAMTCPVRMGIYPGQGPACSSNITMSFYVPGKDEPAPAPTAKDVHLDSTAPHQYYVISFGGFSKYSKNLAMAEEMGNYLKSKGINDFVEAPWYTAGYDSPFRIFNRHNEVWFMRKTPRMIKIQ